MQVIKLSDKLNLLKKALGNYWSNGSENLFYCPSCKHRKRKLSINTEKDVFKCWICDLSGTKISQLIRKFAPSYYADWRQIAGEVDLSRYETIFEDSSSRTPEVIDLPDNFQSLTGIKTTLKTKALRYLYNRGFTDRDIIKWKVGFCNFGEYQDRIIIPSFNLDGNINYFVGRSFSGDWMKYKNPQISKDIIFNDLNINWGDDLILVEGVFDAMKCINAIPLLGSTLKERSLLFQKICEKRPKVFLALDEDAKEKEQLIAKSLIEQGVDVSLIPISPFSDIGEMPRSIIEQRKQKAELVSQMNYLEYKLNF